MKKRIVIALGGNALGNNLTEQMEAVTVTSRAIADLIVEGHEVVVTHGNGPQVGMIHLAFDTACKHDPKQFPMPLSVSVAMSQGYIGSALQNALREELECRGIIKSVSTIVTQVLVDEADPAFQNPTKPIGAFYTKEEADALIRMGHAVMEDAGRGYRRTVPSPRPVDVVEKEVIKAVMDSGQIAIACGGGGIPVVKKETGFQGIDAVIDKDFASAKLAEIIQADYFIILTAVEKVALHFGKPEEQWLDQLSVRQAKEYIAEGHFAKGSMLPKVEAAILFAETKPGRRALITKLEKAREGIDGKTGTVICAEE